MVETISLPQVSKLQLQQYGTQGLCFSCLPVHVLLMMGFSAYPWH